MAGHLILSLRDLCDRAIIDHDVTIQIFRGRDVNAHYEVISRPSIDSPNWVLELASHHDSQFGTVESSFFQRREIDRFKLRPGDEAERTVCLHKNCEKWRAEFTPWESLSDSFEDLRQVLANSRPITLRIDNNCYGLEGPLTEAAYDGLPERYGREGMLAKAALLNIYYRMQELSDPRPSHRQSWSSYLIELIEVRTDRLIAEVAPEMAEAIREISRYSSRHPPYEASDAEHHWHNLPHDRYMIPRPRSVSTGPLSRWRWWPRRRSRDTMASIKSGHRQGNLQLTIAEGRTRSVTEGRNVTLLDADIDEKEGFEHHLEAAENHMTGGKTHPFHVWEILSCGRDPEDVGYRLERSI